MSVSKILELDASIFVYGLALIVCWKMLTYKINMRGLLADKSQPSHISPERVQLLISTFVLAIQYVRESTASQDDSLPMISAGWLYLFGGSSLIYSVRKGVEKYRANQQSRRRIGEHDG
jgi:hypothetical protein